MAKALDVDVETLLGQHQQPPAPKVQTRLPLDPGVHVAYELIKERYKVDMGDVINMAPLFFALLAEGSLAWRQAQLNELDAAIKTVLDLDGDRKRCARHAVWTADESGYEQDAINKGDLFGDPYPDDYEFQPDEWWDGPFADYLRKLADDLGKPGVVDVECDGRKTVTGFDGMPSYSVCRDDLAKVAPLDSRAAYALRAGDVGLSEIPEVLQAEDAADKREAWLEEQLSPESKERLARFAELAKSLRLESNTGEGADPKAESCAGG